MCSACLLYWQTIIPQIMALARDIIAASVRFVPARIALNKLRWRLADPGSMWVNERIRRSRRNPDGSPPDLLVPGINGAIASVFSMGHCTLVWKAEDGAANMFGPISLLGTMSTSKTQLVLGVKEKLKGKVSIVIRSRFALKSR
jgi:hypothetical protein